MNIEVSARIRPLFHNDERQKLKIDNQNRVGGTQGAYFTFKPLHRGEASIYDVYHSSVEPLLSLFVSGFNCCVLVLGESGTGKSYTIAGHGSSSAGLVSLLFENLFHRIDNVGQKNSSGKYYLPRVSLQMYEVRNETVKDLLKVPGITSTIVDLGMSPEHGVHVKDGNAVPVPSAKDGTLLFQQGWANRIQSITTEYGSSEKQTSVIIHVDLEIQTDDFESVKSCFTIVEIASIENIVEDVNVGSPASRGLVALRNVVTMLSRNPQPNRVINFNESKLTQMLQEQLGGNCKTRALLCMKPATDPALMSHLLQFCSNLAQIRTFPIANDYLAQGLLTQYRSQVIDLLHQLGVAPAYSGNAILNNGTVRADNVHLLDQNEWLRQKLGQLHDKYGNIALSRTDLSHQLIMTEEEKLKVSQSMVELQIENNRIKEEAEATTFDLTNKIFQLENDLINSESERTKQANIARNSIEKLNEMEKERRDLADEYVTLKTNYLAVVKEHEKEAARNEELSMELLNQVNAKASFMKQLRAMNAADRALSDPEGEIRRVQSMLRQHTPKHADDIRATRQDRKHVEQSLFGSEQKYKGEISRINNMYDDTTRKLEQKILLLGKELTETRILARDRQHKLSQFNAKILVAENERSKLETMYNRMQHKVKDLNEEYRSRLIKYVQDIAAYVDKEKSSKSAKQWQTYIEDMVSDVKKAFKQREEQLSQAAQQFKTRLTECVRKYEEILTAYLQLKTKVKESGVVVTEDFTPDEATWNVNEDELASLEQKEIRRLRDELNASLSQLDHLRLQMDLNGHPEHNNELSEMGKDQNWSSLRKQLREFTLNTQQELEKERAELLTENQIVSEQLKQNQDYIDKHLLRYKEEIDHLRRKLGMDPTAPLSTSPFTLR